MAKNAGKLYYPIKEAVASLLPLVDEFVIAIGDCDEDDNTLEEIQSLNSDKIKIIRTTWDLEKYPNGMENAHQTDIAKEHCTGDWLFYVQADEVVHEKDLPLIREKCEQYVDNPEVEGFLFKYKHFFGDFDHCHKSHAWYRREIRIVRNDKDIHSWRSAQSFRKIPDFDGVSYRQKEGTYKLKVIALDAHIYHYGWVRPPYLMKKKMKALSVIHKGKAQTDALIDDENFLYGPLQKIQTFKKTHPAVMKDWIARFDWKNELQYTGGYPTDKRKLLRHEKWNVRLLSWVENTLLGERTLGGNRNYVLLKDTKK